MSLFGHDKKRNSFVIGGPEDTEKSVLTTLNDRGDGTFKNCGAMWGLSHLKELGLDLKPTSSEEDKAVRLPSIHGLQASVCDAYLDIAKAYNKNNPTKAKDFVKKAAQYCRHSNLEDFFEVAKDVKVTGMVKKLTNREDPYYPGCRLLDQDDIAKAAKKSGYTELMDKGQFPNGSKRL